MEKCQTRRRLVAVVLAVLVAGCTDFRKGTQYVGDANLEHYKDVATEINYPTICEDPNPLATNTSPPRRIRHLDFNDPSQIWDMPLIEAQQIALSNITIIRERDQFLSPRNPLMVNPEAVASSYDPAIQESDVRFGSRGVEAALSDFDAQFSTSMLWGRSEQVQNNQFLSGGLTPGATLTDETGAFSQRLQKQFADSGSFAVIHNWNYSGNNVPSRLFSSVYEGYVRAEYRRPLLAKSGTAYTRVFGATGGQNLGTAQGVVISRINNDISIADFELNVQNLLRDVENTYWDLSLAYRAYRAEKISLESAIGTWRVVKANYEVGREGGSLADEAQARDNLFESQERTELALADLYSTEGQLRRLLGLSVNEGRIIRPSDEPTRAEYRPDWHMALAEGLTRRIELRKQKWQIKSLEEQLKASRSLTRPELDFVSAYQVNGFGDTLWTNGNDNDGVTPHGLRSGFGTLTQGDQTGWNLGFEFRMPIGYRAAHAQVKHYELRVARARAALAAQELEVSHELSNAFQAVDRWYKTAQTNFNRWSAAQDRTQAFRVEYERGKGSLDLLLRSQISRAQAEVAYYRSLTEYNKAITDLEYRKGALLEHDNVMVAEGLWDAEAYPEAMRRAWARSHARDNPFLHTEPAEFVADGYAGPIGPQGPLPPTGNDMQAPAPTMGYPADSAVPPAPPVEHPPAQKGPAIDGTPMPQQSPMLQQPPMPVPKQAPLPQANSGSSPPNPRKHALIEPKPTGFVEDRRIPVSAPHLPTQVPNIVPSVPRSDVMEPTTKVGDAWKARTDDSVSEGAEPGTDVTRNAAPREVIRNSATPIPASESAPRKPERPQVEVANERGMEPKREVNINVIQPVNHDGPVIRPLRDKASPAQTVWRNGAVSSNVSPSLKQGGGMSKADERRASEANPSKVKWVPTGESTAKPSGGPGTGDRFQPDLTIRPYSPSAGSKSELFPNLPTYRWTPTTDTDDGWRQRQTEP